MGFVFLLLGLVTLINGFLQVKTKNKDKMNTGKMLIVSSLGLFICSAVVFII